MKGAPLFHVHQEDMKDIVAKANVDWALQVRKFLIQPFEAGLSHKTAETQGG